MKEEEGNVRLRDGFNQVCVWEGTYLWSNPNTSPKDKEKAIIEFEKSMKDLFNVRVQFLEEIKTKPDINYAGVEILGTGGRIDLFFAIHDNDIAKFALKRLIYGIKWIEDVLDNDNYRSPIYPERVFSYKITK